ncbi:hypothetical protein MMC29_000277 [Sticta canariensis]|nr:hypothetical protein [Sticta canariensis]
MAMIKGEISEEIQNDLIEQRYLGWSVGIALDEEFDKDNHDVEDKTTDEHDGAQIVKDCVHWLFRFTEDIQRGSTRTVRAWESFSPEGPFKLTQTLYGSQREREDHLRVHDTKNQIEPIGQISIDLLDHGIDPSKVHRMSNQLTGQEYLSMGYEVQVTFDWPELEFHIIIPPKGEFPGERLT